MLSAVQGELDRFDGLINILQQRFRVEILASRVLIVHPLKSKESGAGEVKAARDIGLTVVGLIHGVEVAGLGVMIRILEALIGGHVEFDFPLGVAVGNVEAALAGKRFLERDLNRSFARLQVDSLEDRRADELEHLLIRSKYFVDFHQVKLPTKNPFWIFPYQKLGFQFARAVAADVCIVTHWGKGFSSDGQCSDEFVNKTGGTGITIELGQNGFDEKQMHLGFKVAMNAIKVVGGLLSGKSILEDPDQSYAPVYTWAEIVNYPPTNQQVLDQGWSNFMTVTKGQRLGLYEGEIIASQVDGLILFPKYPDPVPEISDRTTVPPAAELVRILRKIELADLPGN